MGGSPAGGPAGAPAGPPAGEPPIQGLLGHGTDCAPARLHHEPAPPPVEPPMPQFAEDEDEEDDDHHHVHEPPPPFSFTTVFSQFMKSSFPYADVVFHAYGLMPDCYSSWFTVLLAVCWAPEAELHILALMLILFIEAKLLFL